MTEATRRSAPPTRREVILQAAADIFFEQGYAATSIDAIIERLGGSKRTIYAEFGNKEGLFTALVSERAEFALSTLKEHDQGEEKGIEQRLLSFGCELMRAYFTPALLGVFRAITAEGLRFPKLGRAFFEQGPGQAVDRLSEVLEAAHRRGEVRLDDARAAASHFVGMLRDNLHLAVVLGLRPVPSEAEIDSHVASAVQIFLNGVSCPPANCEGQARAQTKQAERS